MDKARRIVLTGATGFLGSYIIRKLLKEGFTNVLGLRRASSRMNLLNGEEDHINWVEGDILDVDSLDEIIEEGDLIIHAAARVSFAKKDVEQLYAVNIQGTQNLVNIALANKAYKFIHVSSIAALGRVKSGTSISEQTEWSDSDENSAYAISKYHAEMEVWRGHAEGLNMAIANPSIILGGGYWRRGSCSIIGSVAKGIPFYPVGASGFVDVRDVAEMIFKLMASSISGERFVCNGHNLTYQELFNNIATALKVAPPQKPLGNFLGELAWRFESVKSIFTKKSPMITKETIRTGKFVSIYDAKKSVNLLGMDYLSIQKTAQDIAEVYDPNKSFGVLKTV